MLQQRTLHGTVVRTASLYVETYPSLRADLRGRNAACSFKVNLKVRHLYLDASHCATFDHGCWDWRLLLPVQTSFPSGVSTPSYTPSMAGGLNQMQHFSEPQTTSCEVAPPGGRDRH